MTQATQQAFDEAAKCEHCKTLFGPNVPKCRDHDHVTGEYRAALCTGCNAKARTPNKLKVFTHNGTGYDHHFYILGLARLTNCVKEDFRSFTSAPAEWMAESERMPYFQSWKIDTIAESSEKIRCIQFGKADIQISFMDSL